MEDNEVIELKGTNTNIDPQQEKLELINKSSISKALVNIFIFILTFIICSSIILSLIYCVNYLDAKFTIEEMETLKRGVDPLIAAKEEQIKNDKTLKEIYKDKELQKLKEEKDRQEYERKKEEQKLQEEFYKKTNKGNKLDQSLTPRERFEDSLGNGNKDMLLKLIKLDEKNDFKKKNIDYKKDSSEYNITIPICYGTDHGYVYPTLVSLTSGCINSNEDTQLMYYIMVPGDFPVEDKSMLKVVEKTYSNCKVEFVNMESKFKGAYISGKIKTPSYYRLMAPSLFTNISKMLYLDGDTLLYEDISPLYNMDMTGLYFRGLLDNNRELETLGVKPPVYICAGVIVMNLDLLRQDNMEKKMLDFIESHKVIRFHDQTTLNYCALGKIGEIPAKYGLYNQASVSAVRAFYYAFPQTSKKYTLDELLEAHKNPSLGHLTFTKPWKMKPLTDNLARGSNIEAQRTNWWIYAYMTEEFDNIYNRAMKGW